MAAKWYERNSMNIRILWRLVALISLAFALAGCRPSPPATSLPEAAKRGDIRLVKQHIAAGSDLNVRDQVGLAAAHHAAMRGDLPMIKALADGGADLSVPNVIGKSPLDLARHYGRTTVAQFLQERESAPGGGRGLVDGGLGVSSVLDSM
jgi:ankyrin repeat protein